MTTMLQTSKRRLEVTSCISLCLKEENPCTHSTRQNLFYGKSDHKDGIANDNKVHHEKQFIKHKLN